MPLPLLALAAIPALAKAGLGAYQLSQKVKRVDSTTPEEREVLANTRQAQAAALPGLASYQARLAQAQNATVQNATLGSGSASDLLASVAAADRVRQNGESNLAVQGQQYHDRATSQLNAVLSAAGARSRADTNRADQARAQLKAAGLNNLSNALTEGASVATYGALNQQNAATPATSPFNPSSVNSLLFPGEGNAYPLDMRGYPGSRNPYLYNRRSSYYGGFPA